MIATVVPTNRPEQMRAWLKAWEPVKDWDVTIVVEDGPTTSDLGRCADIHVCWRDIERDLGHDARWISRGDAGVRSYGYLLAYRMGADLVITLDDDCRPIGENFARSHEEQMRQGLVASPAGIPVRGMPLESDFFSAALNMGLWRGVPDLSGVQQMAAGEVEPYDPPGDRSGIVPAGVLFPLSGMNMSFRPRMVPAMWHPLQGSSSPYQRWDDIWCGLVAKRAADLAGWVVSAGAPSVQHDRASDPVVNMMREASGYLLNEWLWREVRQMGEPARRKGVSTGDELGHVVLTIAADLAAVTGSPDDAYLHKLATGLERWVGMCRNCFA